MPRLHEAITGRWFFLFNGKMQLMNRTSKGRSAPYKKPKELQSNEWTFIKGPPRADAKPQQIFGTFYLKLPAGQKLAEAGIAMPVRSAGVQLVGDNAHLVIKNLTATHPYNDGFNVRGGCRDVVFENIRAIECSNDGISAHEDAECEIDGFVSIGNSTGLCDTGASRTHYKNVFIKDCLGFDVYFISHGEHSMENVIVESSAARAVFIIGDLKTEDSACRVRLKNFLVRRVGVGPQEFLISRGAHLEAERCTIENLMVRATPKGEANFRHCLVTGDPKPEILIWKDAKWSGNGNVYDVKSLRVDQISFTAKTFADFQKLIGSDQASRWSAASDAKDIGAHETAPRKLEEKATAAMKAWQAAK